MVWRSVKEWKTEFPKHPNESNPMPMKWFHFGAGAKVIQNFKWLYRVDHNTISANLTQNQHKTIDQKLYKAQSKQPGRKEEEAEREREKVSNRTLYTYVQS